MQVESLTAAYDAFLGLLAAIVGVLLIGAVLMVTADVAGRYFFAMPLGWVFELTEHILMSVPYLGMAWLVRRFGGHVRVEIVVQMLPPGLQRTVNVVVSLLAALTCGFASYWAIETAWDHYVRGIVTYGIYPIPKFLLVAVVALGLALTAVEFFRKAYEDHRSADGDRSAERK